MTQQQQQSYGVFVMAQQLLKLNIDGIDTSSAWTLWKVAHTHYDAFTASAYNNSEKSEFDCIVEWLDKQYPAEVVTDNRAILDKLIDKYNAEFDTKLLCQEITHGMNGYPHLVGDIVIYNFNTYKEAEMVCVEVKKLFGHMHGIEVGEFVKRDGHDLAKYQGWVKEGYKPHDIATHDDDVSWYDTEDDAIKSISLNQFDTAMVNFNIGVFTYEEYLDAIDALLIIHRNKLKDITSIDFNKYVAFSDGANFWEVPRESMSYHEDVTTHTIGVYIPFTTGKTGGNDE